jgi:uncharacterized membrane protein YtjA (UPF0391 family)
MLQQWETQCLLTLGFLLINEEFNMLNAAVLFLVIALIAGVLGLVGTEIVAANIAWTLFVVFLIFAAVSLVFGRSTRSLD